MDSKQRARKLLLDFKGESYIHGNGVLSEIGNIAAGYGKRALVISNTTYLRDFANRAVEILKAAGVEIAGDRIVPDAAPNAPREDVYRLESYILHFKPDCIITIGGGSAIDATKAANALAAVGGLSPEIEDYFGTGLVSKALEMSGNTLIPLIAVQTSASSGAHLTKYSNITDPVAGQKKLIVDDSIIPASSLFDYEITVTQPLGLTIDGALDGMAHCLEVFFGATGETFEALQEITETAFRLIVEYTPKVIADPGDIDAREAIGLATDLGGYAIMIGGTNGAHLTSFSLVDVTSHGRACGIMNPYYTVFFAPAVEKQLKSVGRIFADFGYFGTAIDSLSGRSLGEAVGSAMVAFSRAINSPTTLDELEGFSRAHIDRALKAAKNPQLAMKLQNMPVPLTADQVDAYMGPILHAAEVGDFSLIKNL